MKPQFDHNVKASFGLWLDNYLLSKGEGFTNYSYTLVKTEDDKIVGYDVFKSPHGQWVYDSSIGSAQIPSGIVANGSFVSHGSGIYLDYNEGRVIVDSDFGITGASVEYAFKEVNIYFTSQRDKSLIFENKFEVNPRTQANAVPPSGASQHVYPAIFIKYSAGQNEPFCLGGEDKTVPRIRTVIFADSEYLFDGVCGILRDSVRKHFAYLEGEDIPFNQFGDFKETVSSFNYPQLALSKTPNGSNLIFINRVTVSPFTDQINSEIGKNVVAGFVDFEIEITRFPRI